MQILEKRQTKRLTNIVADGEKEQPPAILTKLAHGGGLSVHPWKQEIRLSLSFFRVEQAHRLTGFERRYGVLHAGFHDGG